MDSEGLTYPQFLGRLTEPSPSPYRNIRSLKTISGGLEAVRMIDLHFTKVLIEILEASESFLVVSKQYKWSSHVYPDTIIVG